MKESIEKFRDSLEDYIKKTQEIIDRLDEAFPEEEYFKVGDKVEIIGNKDVCHRFKMGQIGVIVPNGLPDEWDVVSEGMTQCVHKSDIKKV